MRIGIYPGSFDPMTKGHLDIIERASKLVDELIVAVLINPNKQHGMLSFNEREKLIAVATQHLSNVKVACFEGLLTDYAREMKASVIIRGIRSSKDLEMELSMAQINKHLGKGLETIFLMTDPAYAAISSSVVRELIAFKGDFKEYVPSVVYEELKNKRG